MKKKILVMDGDGVGPEVNRQAFKVLRAVADVAGITLEVDEALVGGAAFDATGKFLPEESLEKARDVDAILFGAVGGPKWDTPETRGGAEKALLTMRKELDLFANLRPAKVFDELIEASTLKRRVVQGTDMMVIRELAGGIYFGEPRGIFEENGEKVGRNTLVYSERECERIIRVGFEMARKRRNKLTSVDKANVLEATQLWRATAERLSAEYPDVQLNHLYVDAAAMELIRAPAQLDTIVTTNMFGDILSDEASMLTGSIGMLPSASLGPKVALYEPIHGSAPDIAGQDKANPLASILSAGMMFRYTFDMPEMDDLIQKAVGEAIKEHRTGDIFVEGTKQVGCEEMGELVMKQLHQLKPIAAASPA